MPIQASPRFHVDAIGWGDGWERSNEWLGDRFERGGRQDEVFERPSISLVSVGTGVPQLPTTIEPIDRVPGVVPIVIPPPPPYVPPTPPGGTEPPQPIPVLPEVIHVSWSDWMAGGGELPADWNQYPHASDHPIYTGVGVTNDPGPFFEPEEPLSILGDIYDAVDTSLGGWLPGGVPVGGLPPAVYQPQFQAGLSGVPPLNPAMVPPAGSTVSVAASGQQGMVYKKVCGQYRWVKQKRRRRKQLATQGDLRDLAALQGILGNGKAFQTWIATHAS